MNLYTIKFDFSFQNLVLGDGMPQNIPLNVVLIIVTRFAHLALKQQIVHFEQFGFLFALSTDNPWLFSLISTLFVASLFHNLSTCRGN